LRRFQQNDSALTEKDIIALQIGFTVNKQYRPYKILDAEHKILDLVAQEQYEEAVKVCDSILAINPLDFIALMEKSYSLMKLQKPEASFYREQVMKIIRAV